MSFLISMILKHEKIELNLLINYRVKELNIKGLTKEEIAKAVGCGIATVYKVLKSQKKAIHKVSL